MSKTIRKHKPIKLQSPQTTAHDRKIVFLVIITILTAIPFFVGKYIELSSPGPFDSGANVYSAAHILAGAKIGVEEKQSASIGTLLVNILGVWLFGYNDFGPKLVQGILQAAALILMFIAMRKLFGMLPAAVGVIVASVYLSAPLIAKLGNDKMQYTVAAMVLSMSCFVLRQLPSAGSGQAGGKWWYAVLAGAFAGWAPLFKQTGMSVIGAIGIFIVLQPLLKHRTWKQTGTDILLLSAGAIAAIAPLYVWIISWNVQMTLPYLFVWQTFTTFLSTGVETEQVKPGLDYVSTAWDLVPFSRQWPIVLRYYRLLILPIALAVGSIVVRIFKMIVNSSRKSKTNRVAGYDRFVLLFAVWWVLDMAFVWISPRSYEQYYLPINASGAMLGGYLIAVYHDKRKTAVSKPKWTAIGAAGLLLMIVMAWHIFFGIEKSPHTGRSYGRKTRGYTQRLSEVSQHQQYPWEVVGDYIRTNSEPTDKIYVWGWFPGIYVKAQRFSSASQAFCMTREPPQKLEELITELLSEFKQEMPKFIVDSRKRHIPTERPPYELWPIVPKGFMGMEQSGFLPLNKVVIEAYDKAWSNWLRENFDEDEALRYEILKPFREFVMKNYRIVQVFGQHVLFELKSYTANEQTRLGEGSPSRSGMQ